ncbi:unnamed protein product [Brassica oleracea]
MGQEEEGEGEGSIPIAVSGLIDSCHGVRELQGRSYPYSLLHSWFHHSPRANSAPQSCRARRTHASIADLENEKQSHEKKLEQFLRKASEERAAWWSREHEKQCGKWTHELLLHNSPPCSRTVKTKTFELFTEEDDEDFITPPPVNDSKTKTLVKPTNTQMESSLISSVSSFEASYLQLQSAHSPFVEETVKAADRALVSNLQKLSDLKQFYRTHRQSLDLETDWVLLGI